MSFFRLASRLSMASTVPPARTARTSSIGVPKTPPYAFSGICGRAPTPTPTIPHALPISLSSPEGSRTTSPLAAPSPRCTLPPSDRVIPALSLVHWYTQHPSHSTPLPLYMTEHVSIAN
ncbi:hypothetical protein EDB92DRAFT_1944611 [Lactarius akahatsu]|uniref:Uncharacterized protein n=1 Tax=Lactarius akahatsu TaxID=416441 RepID=A0AAD4LJG5_9AGAM|nr:hypothetical protein EDB92DRAFT_1944611 [Lactarius akahatsu]